MSFFAFRSAFGFCHTCCSAAIAWFALVILFAISMSSVRSNKIYDPRYLKWAVKSTKEPLLSIAILVVFGEFQYRCSRCACVIVWNVSFRWRVARRLSASVFVVDGVGTAVEGS